MDARVLVVDDEPEIVELVRVYLEAEGIEVEVLGDGASAIARVEDAAAPPLDLAILDVMLPGASGLEVCRAIRERHSYPVIMLTARGEQVDKICGLTLGADDYVVKPFLPLELVARVKAQLRRYTTYNAAGAGEQPRDGVIICRGLVLDVPAHEATLNERPLVLTPTEFSILGALMLYNVLTVRARAAELVRVYLAHGLKTPLTSVIGYLSLLDEVPDMPGVQRERYTGIALDKACRLP